MRFKKLAAALSAAAVLGTLVPTAVPVMADTSDSGTTTQEAKITKEYRLNGSSIVSGKGTFELNDNTTNSTLYQGYIEFTLPTTPAGYKLEKVTLNLVTERRKSDAVTADIKQYSGTQLTTSGSYTEDSTKLTTLVKEYAPKSKNYGAVKDFKDTTSFQLADWSNSIKLTGFDTTKTVANNTYAVVLSPSGESGTQIQFFTSSVTATDVTGDGVQCVSDLSTLHPSIVVTYSQYNFSVGDTGYDSLSDAINAVESGGTITVNKDVTVSGTDAFAANKSFTIDGQKHTITFDGDHDFVASTNGTAVTVKDLTTSNKKFKLKSQNNATITLDNFAGDVQVSGAYSNGPIYIKNSANIGTLTVYDNVEIENSTVAELKCTVNTTGSDRAKVKLGDNVTITKYGDLKVKGVTSDYTLFEGNYPDTATITSDDTAVNYFYVGGVVTTGIASTDYRTCDGTITATGGVNGLTEGDKYWTFTTTSTEGVTVSFSKDGTNEDGSVKVNFGDTVVTGQSDVVFSIIAAGTSGTDTLYAKMSVE